MSTTPLRLTFGISERFAGVLSRLLSDDYLPAKVITEITHAENARLIAHRLRRSLRKHEVELEYASGLGWWLPVAAKHHVRDLVLEKTGESIEQLTLFGRVDDHPGAG